MSAYLSPGTRMSSAHATRAGLKACATSAMWSCALALLLCAAVGSVGFSVVRAAGQPPGTPGVSFTRTVYPIFEAAQCRGCHADDGVASATRLHFPDPNASPDEIDAFGITLAALVNP